MLWAKNRQEKGLDSSLSMVSHLEMAESKKWKAQNGHTGKLRPVRIQQRRKALAMIIIMELSSLKHLTGMSPPSSSLYTTQYQNVTQHILGP